MCPSSAEDSLCSTPFGITEVGGSLTRCFAISASGAQRLSASQRWAGWVELEDQPRIEVLNAFRHHRGGRDGVVCHAGRGVCAQRLSASQRWADDRYAQTLSAVTCAQRLSASQRWADRSSRGTIPDRSMCSTPFGITEVGGSSSDGRRPWPKLCSTPFGITEVGGRGARARGHHLLEVLNAFRHHRGGRSTSSYQSPSRSCAQRLSASQRWADWGCDILYARRGVLNAFRHHRGGRLRNISAARGTGECSTPFGITEVGGRQQVGKLLRRQVRSTPFGITEVGGGDYSGQCFNESRAQRLSASQRWADPQGPENCGSHYRAQRLSASQRWAASTRRSD